MKVGLGLLDGDDGSRLVRKRFLASLLEHRSEDGEEADRMAAAPRSNRSRRVPITFDVRRRVGNELAQHALQGTGIPLGLAPARTVEAPCGTHRVGDLLLGDGPTGPRQVPVDPLDQGLEVAATPALQVVRSRRCTLGDSIEMGLGEAKEEHGMQALQSFEQLPVRLRIERLSVAVDESAGNPSVVWIGPEFCPHTL